LLRQGGEYHRGSEKWKKQVGRAKSERDEMNDLIEQRAKSLHIPSEKIHEVVILQICSSSDSSPRAIRNGPLRPGISGDFLFGLGSNLDILKRNFQGNIPSRTTTINDRRH